GGVGRVARAARGERPVAAAAAGLARALPLGLRAQARAHCRAGGLGAGVGDVGPREAAGLRADAVGHAALARRGRVGARGLVRHDPAAAEAPAEGDPRHRRRLVHRPVAVVVQAVALLGAAAAARRRAALHAGAGAGARVGAGAQAGAELAVRAGGAGEGEGLGHAAVAVVVQPGAARLHALVGARVEALPPERALAGRGGAAADAVGVAVARGRGEPLVRRAVAVVVAAVADLGAGELARVLAAVGGVAVAIVVAGDAAAEHAGAARADGHAVGVAADAAA